MKETYIIRQVDAIAYDENDWTYNQTWDLSRVTTSAEDLQRVMHKVLRSLGITFKRGSIAYANYGYYLEIVDRRTNQPLFDMVPAPEA